LSLLQFLDFQWLAWFSHNSFEVEGVMAQLSLSGGGNAIKSDSRAGGGGRRGSQTPGYGDDDSFKLGKVELREKGGESYGNYQADEGARPAFNPMVPPARLTATSMESLSSVGGSNFEAEERIHAEKQEFNLHVKSDVKNYETEAYTRFQDLANFSDEMNTARQNIKISSYSPEELLMLKSIVFDIKSSFEQFDLSRRLVSMRRLIEELKATPCPKSECRGFLSSQWKCGTCHHQWSNDVDTKDLKLNGKHMLDMIQLCERILEAQGNCEPADARSGDCGQVPNNFTLCSPMLWLYRLILPRSIRQSLLESGWSTIITLNEDSLADSDMGINAMGIICALIMTVPFGLLGGAGAGFWDELRAAIATCPLQHPDLVDLATGEPQYPANPNTWKDPASGQIWPMTNYGWTYDGIRREFLAYIGLCIMTSLNCVVLSTIYYVFHRGGEKDPRKLHRWWQRKGYLFVVVCGIFTIMSVGSLFALTKSVYVYYSINLGECAVYACVLCAVC